MVSSCASSPPRFDSRQPCARGGAAPPQSPRGPSRWPGGAASSQSVCMRAKVRRRKYLHTPVPAATQYKCLVHTSLWLNTSESLRKLMLHTQACVNTYSYILLHAYFVLAFCINAVPCFMRMSIHKETHTYVSTHALLVHGHLSCVVPTCCIVSLEPWLPLVTVKNSRIHHILAYTFLRPENIHVHMRESMTQKQTPLIANTSYKCMYMCAHTHMYLYTPTHCYCFR